MVGEDPSLLGDAVDVRRAITHHAVVVGTDVPIADVVSEDDKDVGLIVIEFDSETVVLSRKGVEQWPSLSRPRPWIRRHGAYEPARSLIGVPTEGFPPRNEAPWKTPVCRWLVGVIYGKFRVFADSQARRNLPLSAHIQNGADIMNAILVDAIVARAAAILVAVLVSAAAATPASAQAYGSEFYGYGPGTYGYGPRGRYGAEFYGYNPSGYGPGYIGYGFQDIESVQRALGTDPNRLPVGSEAWWAAMDRTGRGGQSK